MAATGDPAFFVIAEWDDQALAEEVGTACGGSVQWPCSAGIVLAEPDGIAVTDQELWNEVLAGYATDRKIDLAMELERQALAECHRVGDPLRRQDVPVVVGVPVEVDRSGHRVRLLPPSAVCPTDPVSVRSPSR
jgi:hypothetical protein